MIVADQKRQPKRMGAHFIGSEGWLHVARGGRLDAEPKSIITSGIKPDEIHLYKSDDHHQNFWIA